MEWLRRAFHFIRPHRLFIVRVGPLSPDDERPAKPGEKNRGLVSQGKLMGDHLKSYQQEMEQDGQPRARRPACHAAG